MLRSFEKTLKHNEFSLTAPATREYWQQLDIASIYTALVNCIINIDCATSLPRHEKIIQLLQIVSGRVKNLGNNEMINCCLAFILDDDPLLKPEHDIAQQYMKTRAMISFHLEHFQDAATYAGLLGDKYFLLHSEEADIEAMHYNRVAGFAYEQCGKVSEACQHYNHYIYSTIIYASDDNEFLYVLKYLVKHRALLITGDITNSLIERLNGDEDELKMELEILLLEAVNFEAGSEHDTYYDYVKTTAEFGMIMAADALVESSSKVVSWMKFFSVVDKNSSNEDNQKIQAYLDYYESIKKAPGK
jgi:hypothetical protein